MTNRIIIQTDKPVIPIELGELLLEFPTDDKSVENFKKTMPEFHNEIKDLKFESEEEEFKATKDILERAYDSIFGKGTFKNVYKQTPSLLSCAQYFQQIGLGVVDELSALGIDATQQEKAQQYINKKKKNKTKK